MDALQIIFIIFILGLILFILLLMFGRLKPEKKSDTSSRYIEILENILEGRKRKAISQLRKLIEKDTDNVPAYIRLGSLLRESGDCYRAYQIHRSLLFRSQLPKETWWKINREIVLDLESMGEISRAIATAEKLLEKGKKDRWLLEKLWRLNFQQSNWEKAAEYYKSYCSIIGIDSRKLRALYKVEEGLERFQDAKYKEARIFFRKALKIYSDCNSALYYLGEAYLRDSREKEAVEWFTRFAQNNPGESHLIIRPVQKILFDLGNFGAMEELYSRLLEVDPENLVALAGLADFKFRKGEIEEALSLSEKALEKNPQSAFAQMIHLKLLAESGKTREVTSKIDSFLAYVASGDKFICKNCNYESSLPRWFCPRCGEQKFTLR